MLTGIVDDHDHESHHDGSEGSTDKESNEKMDDELPMKQVVIEGKETEEASDSDEEEPSSRNQPQFALGDHVYQWCKIVGIPAFHHHGIVMGVYFDEVDQQWFLHICDFSNIGLEEEQPTSEAVAAETNAIPPPPIPPTTQSSLLTSGSGGSNPFAFSRQQCGGWRSYSSPADKWNKVVYNATLWQKTKSSSGTCTSVDCDPPGVVQARVKFLQQESDNLLQMPYHWLHANCECVAVWCKTGTWSTLQGLSFLKVATASNVKSTAVLTGTAAAATTTVTAPSAGLFGWMGFTTTTQVSLLAAQPWLLPALATYGVVTIGIPTAMMWKAQKRWQQTSTELNDEFWSYAAIHQHNVYVEYINQY